MASGERTLLRVQSGAAVPNDIDSVIVSSKGRAIVLAGVTDPALKKAISALGPQQYLLRTAAHSGRPVLWVVGNSQYGFA